MTKELYIVALRGVHAYMIRGVFEAIETAKEYGLEVIKNEKDGWHDVLVDAVTVNEKSEPVCRYSFSREDVRIREENTNNTIKVGFIVYADEIDEHDDGHWRVRHFSRDEQAEHLVYVSPKVTELYPNLKVGGE